MVFELLFCSHSMRPPSHDTILDLYSLYTTVELQVGLNP